MNYNKRCTILFPGKPIDDPLEGTILGKDEPKVFPCSKGSVSSEEQMGVFGKYNQDAFKLHIQGTIKKPFNIKYENDVKRQVYSVKYHRNSTVVIVT